MSSEARNVRPRVGVGLPTSSVASSPGNLGAASAAAGVAASTSASAGSRAANRVPPGAATTCVSPLIPLLDGGVSCARIVKSVDGEVYTGFASYKDLATSQCNFVPMNSNRAINRDVVRQRVQENAEAFELSGRYLEFGQINLIVISSDPSHDFLVMDGQHRCETMAELLRRFSTRDLSFQFRVKVVQTEFLAFQELRHFQRSYPSDPRSFFRSRAEARVATAVLIKMKAEHSDAFREIVLSDRQGKRTGDPPRPYLDDNLLFWLLQDTGLLAAAGDITAAGAAPETNTVSVLERLAQMESLLANLPRTSLGKGATEKMRETARRLRTFLGFFREGGLRWKDLAEKLPPPGAQQQRGRRSEARLSSTAATAAENPECVICLEKPRDHALLPCGHRCACQDCAAAVRDARPPLCPICRSEVSGACRIFM